MGKIGQTRIIRTKRSPLFENLNNYLKNIRVAVVPDLSVRAIA